MGNHPFKGLFYAPIDGLHIGPPKLITHTGKNVSFCRKSEMDWDRYKNRRTDAYRELHAYVLSVFGHIPSLDDEKDLEIFSRETDLQMMDFPDSLDIRYYAMSEEDFFKTHGSPMDLGFTVICNDAGEWYNEGFWTDSDFDRMLSSLSDDDFIWVFKCHV